MKLCVLCYHLYNFKNVKNTHEGVVSLLHGCFHIFKIVLFVPNNTKRLIYMSNYSSSFMGLRRGLQRCIKAVGVCKRKYGRPFSIVIKREEIFTLSTHCWPMFPFYTPCKRQKTKVFLVFSGGIIWEHWSGMS